MAPPTVGDDFPDLVLPDHNGNERSLSSLVAGDPCFLHTYRGFWCPKEQRFFRRLVELQGDLEVAYARIVSLSTDLPRVSAAFRAGLGARWTFLCDSDRVALRRLGLRETTDTVNDPFVPRGFVLDPSSDLRVTHVWDGYWALGRPTNDEILLALRSVAARIRPDWEAPTA